jgi:hypothetical protein
MKMLDRRNRCNILKGGVGSLEHGARRGAGEQGTL